MRSCRPGLLSSFSAAQLFLWEESGFWFAFGTKPFPPCSEAGLSLLGCRMESGHGMVGLGLWLFVHMAPGHQHFLCGAPPSPSRWLYPPVVFSALPETMWLFNQNWFSMEGHSFHPAGMEGLLCAFHSWGENSPVVEFLSGRHTRLCASVSSACHLYLSYTGRETPFCSDPVICFLVLCLTVIANPSNRQRDGNAEYRSSCVTRNCWRVSRALEKSFPWRSLLGTSSFVLGVTCILLPQMCTEEQFTKWGKKI